MWYRIHSHFLAVILLLSGMLACKPQPGQLQASNKPESARTVRVIASDAGFGYEIWNDGKRVILQRHIPAVEGNLPFPDSLLARKTGELCAEKIRNGIFPPSLTLVEVEGVFTSQGKSLPEVL